MAARYEMIFEGDEARLVQSFIKINQQFSNLKRESQDAQRRTQSAQSQFRAFGSDVTEQLSGMVAGFFTVQAGLNELQRGWEAWKQQIEETGTAINEFSQSLAGLTTGAGDAISQVRPELLDIARGGMLSPEQALGAYQAARDVAPMASTESILNIVRTVQPMAALGLDPSQGARGLAMQQRFDPTGGGDPNGNLMLAQMQLAGGDIDRIIGREATRAQFSLQRFGMSEEESAEFMLSAVAAGVPATELVNQMTARAVRGGPAPSALPRGRGAMVDPKVRRKNQILENFNSLDENQRFNLMMSDPETAQAVLGDEAVAALSNIELARQTVGPNLEAALSGDLMARSIREIESDPIAAGAERSRRARNREALAALQGSEESNRRQQLKVYLDEERARERELIESGGASPFFSPIRQFSRWAGVGLAEATTQIERVPGLREASRGPFLPTFIGRRVRATIEHEQRASGVGEVTRTRGFGGGGQSGAIAQFDRLTANLERVNDQLERQMSDGRHVSVGVRE